MSSSGKWGDLAPRLMSGLAMAAVGAGAVWAGGLPFVLLAVLCVGLMVHELCTLTAPAARRDALILSVLAAGALASVLAQTSPFALALILMPPALGAVLPRKDRAVFFAYGTAILLTGYGVVALREGLGAPWVTWLVLVVVATDILGYFGGRIIGGPKFWPKVSPKKTWAGTISGWVGAMAVSAGFVMLYQAPAWLIGFAVLVSFASQLGDIAESAIKRRVGAKDSSALIPGHGGLLDRFDGIIGATVFVIVWRAVLNLPLPVVGG